MDVVKDWEALVSELERLIENGDESCRPLLRKAEAALQEAREKQALSGRDPHER